HFVVWEGSGRRFGRPVVFINDPAGGRRTVPVAEFDTSFTGVVLTFAPGADFRRGGRRPGLLHDLPGRLRRVSGALVVAGFASLLLAVVGLVQPAFILAIVAVLINAVLVATYAAVMWAYDVELAVVGATAALLNVAALRMVAHARRSGVARMRIDRVRFFAASLDGLQLIETLKATGGEGG